jgi:hypothetical protein
VEELRRDEPILFGLSVLILSLMPLTALAALLDDRLFGGVSVWQKPWKFELALLTYALTLAFFARFLPAGLTARRGYRLYSGAVALAIVLELAWIGAAAALGTASHFNATPTGQAIYNLMGLLAVLLTSISAFYAWGIARNPRMGLAPVLHLSLVLGLALVLPLTLITAGFMSASGGHAVGAAAGAEGANGLFLMGWSREHGDLRVPHFFATHAMHFVPAFGLVSAWVWGGARTRPVWLFSAVYVGLVAYAFAEALSGRPFLPFL